MPRKGWESISVRADTWDRLKRYCELRHMSPDQIMKEAIREQEKLTRFAEKIKKVPNTVRVYP